MSKYLDEEWMNLCYLKRIMKLFFSNKMFLTKHRSVQAQKVNLKCKV